MTSDVRIATNQSLFDISVQQCGGIEAVFEIAERNGLSITDKLIAGSTIEISEDTMIDKTIIDYYQMKGIKPATDASIEVMDSLRDEGIDFWAIAVDFVVQ